MILATKILQGRPRLSSRNSKARGTALETRIPVGGTPLVYDAHFAQRIGRGRFLAHRAWLNRRGDPNLQSSLPIRSSTSAVLEASESAEGALPGWGEVAPVPPCTRNARSRAMKRRSRTCGGSLDVGRTAIRRENRRKSADAWAEGNYHVGVARGTAGPPPLVGLYSILQGGFAPVGHRETAAPLAGALNVHHILHTSGPSAAGVKKFGGKDGFTKFNFLRYRLGSAPPPAMRVQRRPD